LQSQCNVKVLLNIVLESTCLSYDIFLDPTHKLISPLLTRPQVLSPFQAILDYELSHNLPPGWVNNCISKTKPYGYWHRLERGEMLMNATWFRGFNSDLHNPELWETFYQQARTKNPALPAKTPPLPQVDGEALFWSMMAASRAPDPWSSFPSPLPIRPPNPSPYSSPKLTTHSVSRPHQPPKIRTLHPSRPLQHHDLPLRAPLLQRASNRFRPLVFRCLYFERACWDAET